MIFSKISCMVGFVLLLSGCVADIQTNDVVSPPYEDHPNLQAAETARLRGDLPQAIHDFRDIIKEAPRCEKAYIGLGLALADVNSVVEAKHTFEKAITLFEESSGVYAGMGITYLLIDQPENAMRSFDKSLALDSRNAKALNGYGIAYDMLGDHKAAQANYRAAMEVNPENSSYEGNLALSMVLSGQEEEGIRILERLSNSPQVTPRVRQNLALAYGLMGDMTMAKKVGRVDLTDEMVKNNVNYIEALRQTKDFSGLIPKNHTTALNETRILQEKN